MLFFQKQSLQKFTETLFYIDIVNIVLALFFSLPTFYCNVMPIRDVNLCADLNKKPKPTFHVHHHVF